MLTVWPIILSMLFVASNAGVLNNHQQQQQYPLHQTSPLRVPQQQNYNYKQQLQYQMQQHDKLEYQQHMKQQQLYYQHQYQQPHSPHERFQHEQQMGQQQTQQQEQQQHQFQQQQEQHHLPYQQTPPTTMELVQQQQQQSFLPVRPTQMLQTAANVIRDDVPQADALRGQPEYGNSGDGGLNSGLKRRPVNRKRKRRPHTPIEEAADDEATAPLNSMPSWRNRNDENNRNNDFVDASSTAAPPPPEPTQETRYKSQANIRRRKPPAAVREPLAALEKEQKLYELRNTKTASGAAPASTPASNRNSENLKTILKNNGGLSLSEILQQKNLSLDDLLKGKHNALQALQTTATSSVQKTGNPRYSIKPKLKFNPNGKASNENNNNDAEMKERPKLTALQKLKLFGASSRPSGTQVGLADHLTTRKKENPLYTITTSSTTTTTAAPSTTRIPLYRKILHQRSTLRPSLLLKNTQIASSVEPTEQPVNMWDHEDDNTEDEKEFEESKEQEHEDGVVEEDQFEEQNEQEHDYIEQPDEEEEGSTLKPEATTLIADISITPKSTTLITTTFSPTMPLTTTSATTTTTTTTELPTTTKELNTSSRRMYTATTRGHGRSTHRYTTSTTSTTTTTTPSTTTTSYSTTLSPQTTTTTTSTTTASSSTMNLTPKANMNLNTEDIRERIQETLLKNLIEKEDTLRKPISTTIEADNEDDLENFFEESVKPKSTKSYETSTITTRMKQFSSSSLVPKPTQNVNIIPDFDNVDDRTDLLELIEDRRSGNRLFKVLEQRNMTLEELIEHRKRGSSQLHLATIVQSPSRFYPDKKVVLQDNMDIVTAFENFPHFNLLNLKSVKPDEIKTDSQGSSYFTSIIDIEPTDEVYTNGKTVAGGAVISPVMDNKVAFLPDRSDRTLNFFPSWKTLALASLAGTGSATKDTVASEKLTRPFYLPQSKMLLDAPVDEDDYEIKENQLVFITHETPDDATDDGDVDDVDGDDDDSNNDYRAQSPPIQAAVRVAIGNKDIAQDNLINGAHDLVDLELSGHGFKRSSVAAGALAGHKYGNFFASMPAGIKSAIVASATIVLTALVTFMVIFAVCRWKQKRSRMTNIMKSYNAMKSKFPAIATTSMAISPGGGNASSHLSSLREMNSLMGGSGLSVNATITTTTTGVPNTPSPSASQSTIAVATTALPSSAGASGCLQRQSSHSGGNKLHQLQHQHHHQHHQHLSHAQAEHFQRHSSLLIQRLPHNNENPTNLSILSNCNLADLKRSSSDLRGSTTSLSFSLTSGHNNKITSPPASKTNNINQRGTTTTHNMNTMDANSPEVQEYLFDTLRNSF